MLPDRAAVRNTNGTNRATKRWFEDIYRCVHLPAGPCRTSDCARVHPCSRPSTIRAHAMRRGSSGGAGTDVLHASAVGASHPSSIAGTFHDFRARDDEHDLDRQLPITEL